MKKKTISLFIAVLLILTLLPVVPAQAVQTTVYANTAEELENAIASNTRIILSNTTYAFEYDLGIYNVENLDIVGVTGTKIISTSKYSMVLEIYSSMNIYISNTFLGHDIPAELEECQNCVIWMMDAENITFENCDVYGTGLEGFEISRSSVKFNDSTIRDCSKRIGSVINSIIEFNKCVIKNNGYMNNEYGYYKSDSGNDYESSGLGIAELYNASNSTLLTFNNCEFLNNNNTYFKYEEGTESSDYNAGFTRVNNCTFTGNTWQTDGEAPPPADKPAGWAEDEVNAAIEAGLVPENLQKNYQNNVSRGEVAQMFINLIEIASGQSIEDYMVAKGVSINDNAFTDTNDRAVLAANALGIINGVGNNKFDPDGILTRGAIATLVNRVARTLGVDTEGYTHTFTDVSGNYADKELGWPVHAGIIEGVGNNKFDPDANLTTEGAIVLTYRALAPLKAK